MIYPGWPPEKNIVPDLFFFRAVILYPELLVHCRGTMTAKVHWIIDVYATGAGRESKNIHGR